MSSDLPVESSLATAIVPDPLMIAPQASLNDAIQCMNGARVTCLLSEIATNTTVHYSVTEARASCVLVVQDKQLVGIFTERDAVRWIATQKSLTTVTLAEVMTYPVISMQQSALADLFSVAHLLHQHRFRHLPILDDRGQVAGLLTHESLQHLLRPIDVLRFRSIADVMTSNVIQASPDASVLDVSDLMVNHRVSSVVITTQPSLSSLATSHLNVPVGIVTERDIVQFYSLGLDLTQIQVQAVMRTPVFAVRPSHTLWSAQNLMQQKQLHQVIVVGESGELVGIVTQTTLLRALDPAEICKVVKDLGQKVEYLESEKVELLQKQTIALEQQVQVRTAELLAQAQRERLIADVFSHIRSAQNLQDILDITVTKVRQFLQCDRLLVYQFEPDWATVVVAASDADPGFSCLGQRVHDPCFTPDWVSRYREGRVRVVPDIYTIPMADCHRELLERLQIRAKLIVPMVRGEHLWGLLSAIEVDHARNWLPEEVSLLEQIATQLAIAIQQTTAYQALETERKQAEAERQQAERLRLEFQLLENILEISLAGYWDWHIPENYEYLSRTFKRMFGYEDHELPNTPDSWQRLILLDDLPGVLDCFDRHVQSRGEIPFYNEVRYRHKNGSIVWVICSGRVIEWDENGNPLRMIGCHIDITNRKQAEQLLKESEERWLLALRGSNAGIWDWNLKTHQVFRSDRWKEMWGYVDDEINDGLEAWSDRIHPEDSDRVMTALEDHFAQKTPFYQAEYRIQRKDGSYFWILDRGRALWDESGQPIRMVGSVTDINDRKQAEESVRQSSMQLQAANQELEAFAYSVSHDLRAPLRTIDGFSQALLEDYGAQFDAEARDYFDRIRGGIQRMSMLIDDLLRLSRVSRFEMHYQCINLSDVVHQFTAELQQSQPQRQVEFRIEPQAIAYGDTNLLGIVLDNLLGNAWKFTSHHAHACIEFGTMPSSSGETIYFVRDDGAGFDQSYVSQLFGVFQRLHDTREFPGTGIGLATVQRVIHRHGGRVWAEGAIEQGATVYFTLPAPPTTTPIILQEVPPT